MSRMSEHFFGDQLAFFDGATYEPARDEARLKGLLARCFWEMRDGDWHTLGWLAERTGGTEASVSARLRDLRKPRFGAYVIERRYIGNGLFEYRLERKI